MNAVPMYDQHLHSRHSMDSNADPAACVESAIARGLAGLTFTEHFDPHPQEWADCVYDDRGYSETIRGLRNRFGSEIFIGKGIEVGYCRDRMDFVLDFLGRHEFDLVILSAHYLGDRAVHSREQWNDLDAEEGTRLYLETVLEAARFSRSANRSAAATFHVLGHLDLVKRYTRRFFNTYGVSHCGELIERILGECLEADLVPEINTSSLRQNLSEPMPGLETIVQYARLGGTAMSIGSDAHRPEDVGTGLDDAVRLLRQAGIGHAAMFKEGVRTEVPLA